MRVLGIDPGLTGAGALYCAGETVPSVPGGLFDLPTMGEGASKELDYRKLSSIIWDLKPQLIFIERVGAMPGRNKETGEQDRNMGTATSFKFGGAYYAARCVCYCLGIPPFKAEPSVWKRHFGLIIPKGTPEAERPDIKEAARQLVLKRWPSLAPFLSRKKDQGRAEAFLIAAWGIETQGGRIKPRGPPIAEEPIAQRRRIAKRALRDDDDFNIPE